MRYDAEHKDRTRKRLLTEAASALRAEGPERVGVATLMGKLGLTHGGFYAHFKSKDELVASAIDEMFEQTGAWFRKKIGDLPPEKALAGYIDFYLSDGHSDSPGRGCALPAMATDVSRLGPVARHRFALGVERLQTGFARLIAQMGRSEEEALDLAVSVISEMSGAVALSRAVDDPEQGRRIRGRTKASVLKRLGLPA